MVLQQSLKEVTVTEAKVDSKVGGSGMGCLKGAKAETSPRLLRRSSETAHGR